MIRKRPANQRGGGKYGWLETRHSFSFSDYYDPAHMNFGSLRVMNEDWIQPGQGFGMHGHRDMEIITYVLEGALGHKDSLGNGAVLHPGELQCMTAGTGIRHSEFNESAATPAHLYQIWILPDRADHIPSYDQKAFPESERQGRLRVVASADGRDGSLTIHQDAEVYLSSLEETQQVTHSLRRGRSAWLQVLRGAVQINGMTFATGDGAALSDEAQVAIKSVGKSEVMLFDLP